MELFYHFIYELRKGLRSLVLYTVPIDFLDAVEKKLRQLAIPSLIRSINGKKINIFFGAPECIEVVLSFGDKPLNELTCEEDFILGIMLGYNRIEQCRRYLNRKKMKSDNITPVKDLSVNFQARC